MAGEKTTTAEEEDTQSDTGHRWGPGDRRRIGVVSFSHAVQHSYVAAFGLVYPFMLADFHVSYAVLGAVLGAAGVVGGLLQGAAGVVRRLSTRFLLGTQNLAIGAVTAAASAAPGFGLFAAALFAGKLVSWPQHPVGSAFLTDHFPKRRGLVLSWHTTGGNVGTVLAPLLASVIVLDWGWRWALVTFAIIMAAGSVVTFTLLHGRSRRTRPPAGTTATPPARATAAPADGVTAKPLTVRRAIVRRQAASVLVAGMISGAGRGVGVLATYIPAYLRTGLHLSALDVGWLATMVTLGAVIGPVFAGQLSDRLGRTPVLYSIYLVGAAALAGYVWVGPSVVALALVGLAVGVFSYSEQPIRQALFSDAMQGTSARAAFGAYFAISQSVGALWLTVLGVIITTVGFHAAFGAMGGSFVVAAAIIAWGTRPTPSRSDGSA